MGHPDVIHGARRRGRTMTLNSRLRALLGFLTTLLVLFCAIVLWNLRGVREDASEFLEETREAGLAHEILSTLEQLSLAEEIRVLRNAHESPDSIARLVGRARSLMAPFAKPPDADPSPSEHEAEEAAILKELEADLSAFEAHAGRSEPEAVVTARLAHIHDLARHLEQVTDEEAHSATRNLRSRTRDVLFIMFLTTGASLLSLLVVFVLVKRHVVKPLLVLREGTEIFGEGGLAHRIAVNPGDEIGDLAAAFNRMAASLAETHQQLEDRVQKRTDELLRAARLADLGTFAAGVAHEVNTPLASIASSAEGLERRLRSGNVEREEQIQYLQTIAREAYRARDIAALLLLFAREDHRDRSQVLLQETLAHVARLLRHQMEERGIRLQTDIDADAPALDANGSELMQVVLNLLKNALDASPPGGCIRVSYRRHGKAVLLAVEDEGPGIRPEVVDRIFDPFYTTKPPGEGTGLGLSLVYRIVAGLDGRIEVGRSTSGGACLSVTLPVSAERSLGIA